MRSSRPLARATPEPIRPGRPILHRERWRALRRLAVPHRAVLAWGTVWTLVTVGSRLALPWALVALVHACSADGGRTREWALVFGALMALTGLGEYAQRVSLARFALGWSRGIRGATMERLAEWPRKARASRSGDLVSRLVADVARFKAQVKVFLIYVLTNLLLLGGATAILAGRSVALGAVFGLAMLVAAALAWRGARSNLRVYFEHRTQEGSLASMIERWDGTHDHESDFDELNRESGRWEVREIWNTGRTTWLAHVAVALFVVLALAYAAPGAGAGASQDGSRMPLVFIGYVFLLTRPLIRLTRHGARSGKLVACATRLTDVLLQDLEPREDAALPALARELAIEWRGPDAAADSSVRVTIEAGTRTAVVGPGRLTRSLLRALAGESGVPLSWDGEAVGPGALPPERLAHVHAGSSWRRADAESLLAGDDGTPLDADLARDLGITELLDARRSPKTASRGERARVALAVALARRPDVLLVGEPAELWTEAEEPRLWRAVVERTRDRTVVRAAAGPLDLDGFERVIEVDDTGIAFDGTPSQWRDAGRDLAAWGQAASAEAP